MPWRVSAVDAHPQHGGLRGRHLANVAGLLLGGHRPAAHDGARPADREPGEVVAVHRAPGAREQVVGELEPDLQRGVARVGREPLALVDELARVRATSSSRVIGAGHPAPRMNASRASRARARPRPGQAVADRAALEPGDRQDAGDAGAQERLVRAARGPPASASPRPPSARRRRPSRSSHVRVVPGQDRAVERGRRQLRSPRTRKTLALVASDRWPSVVRNSASSAPARRASSRAKT